MTQRKLETWDEVLEAVDAGARLCYLPPLDIVATTVICHRRGKGRKVRVVPLTNQADPFWADEKHLGRFWVREGER